MSEVLLARRRWLQFQLSTMLVAVTVIAVWLGWELNYIRERRAARSSFHGSSNGRIGVSTRAWNQPASPGDPPRSFSSAQIPFWRTWLGDEALTLVLILTDTAESEYARMTYLFPEAHVRVQDSASDTEYATAAP